MVDEDDSVNGYLKTLTGDQVKFVRNALGEPQHVFARRFACTGPVIHRVEKRATVAQAGPIIILISDLAEKYGITIPNKLVNRSVDGKPTPISSETQA